MKLNKEAYWIGNTPGYVEGHDWWVPRCCTRAKDETCMLRRVHEIIKEGGKVHWVIKGAKLKNF